MEEVEKLKKELREKEKYIDILERENRVLLRLVHITEKINDIQDNLMWARMLTKGTEAGSWVTETYQFVRDLSRDLTKLRKEINMLWDEVL